MNIYPDYLAHYVILAKVRRKYGNYLMHFGRLGMHWGERNGPPYPLTREQMSITERNLSKLANRSKSGRLRLPKFERVWMSKQEYAHFQSEIATHISDKQRTMPLFAKNIGSYTYVVDNSRFDNTYDCVGKEEIGELLYSFASWLFDD